VRSLAKKGHVVSDRTEEGKEELAREILKNLKANQADPEALEEARFRRSRNARSSRFVRGGAEGTADDSGEGMNGPDPWA
jgi:hypothetical protein